MELLLNDEQRLLVESAETFMGRAAGPKQLREARARNDGHEAKRWQEIAEAGWLALAVPEAAGGLGLGAMELALVLEQGGRALLTEPVASCAAAARGIAEGDSATLQEMLLGRVAGGEAIVLPAFQETPLAAEPESAATRAEAADSGYRLTGTKRFIANAASAEGFLVNAGAGGADVLCYVPADADGVSVSVDPTVDGSGIGTLTLDGATVPADYVVAGANRAAELTGRIAELAILGTSAELLGVMEQALDTALDYIKTRRQFDRPIGSFQALQHRAVNNYIEVELTRSLLYQVAEAWDGARGTPAMISAVKARASGAALNVTKSAIQLHGAIGFTDEHDIGLFMRRAMALSSLYGNEAAHRSRYAKLSGL